MASSIPRQENHPSNVERSLPYNTTLPKTKLGPDIITLCGQPKTDARVYCGRAEIPRRRLYKKDEENKPEVKAIAKATTIKVLKEDAAKNSKIIAVSVCIFGGLGSIGWIAGPVGGIPGTSVGVASGMVVAGMIINRNINKKINISITFSDHYATWRSQAIVEKVYPIFRNFIDMDKELEEFLCPISKDICSIPVIDPAGTTYDQSFIHAHIETTTKYDDVKVLSPMRNGYFSKNDLVINVKYCRDLIKKCVDIYKRVLAIGTQNEIQHGMKAVIDNTHQLMENIRIQLACQLFIEYEDQVRSRKMSLEEREMYIHNSTKQWDFRDPA